MPAISPYAFTLGREEQQQYLVQLGSALGSLSAVIDGEVVRTSVATAENLRREGRWDRDITPYLKQLSGVAPFVERLRDTYALLQDRDSAHEPLQNRRWPKALELDSCSGLPRSFALRDLGKLVQGEKQTLAQLPVTYEKFANLFMNDTVRPADIPDAARSLRQSVLEANAVYVAQQTGMLDAFAEDVHDIRLLDRTAVQDIWMLRYIGMPLHTGKLQINTLIVAQNAGGETIQITPNGFQAANTLARMPVLEENLQSWYTLQRVDEAAETLHPLFISRVFVGPFDSAANTREEEGIPRIATLGELARAQPGVRFLRCSHLYGFSPDTREIPDPKTRGETILRQDVVRREFADEIIIAPPSQSRVVSERLGGANVRVFEYEVAA